MGKLSAIWKLFRKGNEVANVESWKLGKITVDAVAAFLAAILSTAQAFGYSIPMDNSGLMLIAGGVYAFGGMVVTIITSKRAGLPAEPVPYVPTYGAPNTIPVIPNAPIDWLSVAERDFPKDTGGGS